MARFVNSIIDDYSRSIKSLRLIDTLKNNPFLGPVEQLVASFIGAPSLAKDGLEKRTEALKKRIEDPNYLKNLLSEKGND
jgi:hypothetical protein